MRRIIFILIFFFSLHSVGFTQAIDPQTTKIIRYFPNPAVSYINFEIPEPTDSQYSLQIYNFIGKKIVDLPNIPSRVNLPLDDFFRGIYIFQLRNKLGKIVESGKFQVVK